MRVTICLTGKDSQWGDPVDRNWVREYDVRPIANASGIIHDPLTVSATTFVTALETLRTTDLMIS